MVALEARLGPYRGSTLRALSGTLNVCSADRSLDPERSRSSRSTPASRASSTDG